MTRNWTRQRCDDELIALAQQEQAGRPDATYDRMSEAGRLKGWEKQADMADGKPDTDQLQHR